MPRCTNTLTIQALDHMVVVANLCTKRSREGNLNKHKQAFFFLIFSENKLLNIAAIEVPQEPPKISWPPMRSNLRANRAQYERGMQRRWF